MKKSIAIITSGYFPVPPVKGGAIESLVSLIIEENNKKADVNLTVYSMYDKEAKKISDGYSNAIIKYISIPWIIKMIDLIIYFIFKNILKKKKSMSYRYIAQRLYYIRIVSKEMSITNYDAIVFQNHPTLLNILKRHGNNKKYKGKYYYHAHNEIYNSFGNDDLLKDCKKFICVSNYIKNCIEKALNISDEAKFTVLRNRVDEQKFKNIDNSQIKEFMHKYSIPEGFTLFTFTGRLNPEKGVKELLIAYKNARPSNSKLIIAGSYFFGSGMKSDYEIELEKIAKDIRNQIVFTGNIEYSDMPKLYHISDIIILPSIWNDPAPLTVVESLTCGKPLITTYSGGIPEYANERNSLIYPVDDNLISSLSDGIKYLSENIEIRRKLRKNALEESENWTKESFYIDFINCID